MVVATERSRETATTTMTMLDPREDLGEILRDAATRHNVTGASLAVLHDGEILECATGIASVRTGQPVTPRTLFQIGSTSKAYTATLVMQLVADGRIDLDDPVLRHLPELHLGVQDTPPSLTVRHLLTHTSGIDNGPYTDHGRGDDAVERYVTSLEGIPFVHPPGERFSYSNAAYVIAGHLVERLTGRTWDDALRQQLLGRAALAATFSLPEEAILHPVAVGHIDGDDGQRLVAPRWGSCGRAMGPTGTTMCATAGDLVRFARLHLRHDHDPEATSVLPPDAVAAMQEPQVRLPASSIVADGWGHGWIFDEWDGALVLGHTGHNLGSGSHLRFSPERDAAVALVFNSPGDAGLFHELFALLFDGLYGIRKPEPWIRMDPTLDIDLNLYAGNFERHGLRIEVTPGVGELAVEVSGSSHHVGLLPAHTLEPADRSAFGSTATTTYTVTPPDGCVAPHIVFDGFRDGRPEYLYTSVFAARRVR
jgi:CubicO group peptidase (beta-lactamase class C family)